MRPQLERPAVAVDSARPHPGTDVPFGSVAVLGSQVAAVTSPQPDAFAVTTTVITAATDARTANATTPGPSDSDSTNADGAAFGLAFDGRAGRSLGRRGFLQFAGISMLGGVLAACTSPTSNSRSATGTPSTGGGGSVVERTLPIPPLLAYQTQGDTKVFRLTAQKGESQFISGQTTSTFGFNGNYLGPTLRAALGDAVQIDVTNGLGEITTVHWHGMHLPAMMDGGPMQTIADGDTWSPRFTIQQPAATLWYHPHMMGETLRQVGMGLVGLFILDDTAPALDDLPHTYGVDDIPLILQAQAISADGQFQLNGRGGRGGGNATTLVNGAISPTINTPHSRLRLRLLNGSSEAIYNIGLASGATFHQVASDGGPLEAPAALTQLRLAPAERAEIVFDVDPSAPTALQNFGGNNGGGRGGGDDGDSDSPAGPLLTINPTNVSGPPTALPPSLGLIDRLSSDSAVQTRQFVLAGGDRNPTINGQSMTSMADLMDMSEVLQVGLGTTEIWNVINRSNDTHVFHVHDIQFQILDRDGSAPEPNESGRKDTVVVSPRETVRLIMRFDDFADPQTPYMYHCHLLNHEDNGMMGQFVVV